MGLSSPQSSWAEAPTSSTSCTYFQNVEGQMNFQDVEMIARDHRIGSHRAEDVILSPWIAISDQAYLGLDQTGRILQILKLKDRVVAYPLSSDVKMKSLFLNHDGVLLAIDDRGELYQFKWSTWSDKKLHQVIHGAAINLGLSMCSAGAVVLVFSSIEKLVGVPIATGPLLMASGMGVISMTLLNALVTAMYYGDQNQRPNGFEKIGAQVPGFKKSSVQIGCHGLFEDHELRTAHETFSLNQILSEAAAYDSRARENFDVTEEHDSLPRGIPEKNF